MSQRFFVACTGLLNSSRKRIAINEALLTYAKIEYKNEWKFAYEYMVVNNGRGPNMETCK